MSKEQLQQLIRQSIANGKVKGDELERLSEGLLTVASKLSKGV